MKPVRTLVIALLGYAAVLAPTASQARDVQLSLPGISVRLPAPPFPILLPPGVVITGGEREVYDREREYRRMPPPRFYREDYRYERRDYRHDRYDDRRDWNRRDWGHRGWDRHDREEHHDHGHRGWDR